MENVIMHWKNQNKGQVVIIGALVAALALIVLITVLNSVLFAGNLSADSPTPESQNIEEFDSLAEREVGTSIIVANEENNNVNTVQRDIEDINRNIEEQTASSRSEIGSIEYRGTTDGQMVSQTSTDSFIDNGNNMTVMTEPDDIRQFQIVVDGNDNSGVLSTGDTFSIIIDSGSSEQRIEISDDNLGNNELTIETFDADGNLVDETQLERIEYDITTGELNGERGGMKLTPDVDDIQEIEFEHEGIDPVDDSGFEGKYTIVGEEPTSTASGSQNVIYSVDIDMQYTGPNIDSQHSITVAPCDTSYSSCPKPGNIWNNE